MPPPTVSDICFLFNTFPTIIHDSSHQGGFAHSVAYGSGKSVGKPIEITTPSYMWHKSWDRTLPTYRSYISLPRQQRRALSLLYDNVYNYRPHTVLGELWEMAAPFLGRATRLVCMNPYVTDAKELTRLYRAYKSKTLSDADRATLFVVGDYCRRLYAETHRSLSV